MTETEEIGGRTATIIVAVALLLLVILSYFTPDCGPDDAGQQATTQQNERRSCAAPIASTDEMVKARSGRSALPHSGTKGREGAHAPER